MILKVGGSLFLKYFGNKDEIEDGPVIQRTSGTRVFFLRSGLIMTIITWTKW